MNIRDFDNSGDAGSYPGYTHQMTVDIIENRSKKGEVKFILPNN